ncbi:MAG: hypothetical protein PVJ58_09170, partial [Chromatiales bacterium]
MSSWYSLSSRRSFSLKNRYSLVLLRKKFPAEYTSVSVTERKLAGLHRHETRITASSLAWLAWTGSLQE